MASTKSFQTNIVIGGKLNPTLQKAFSTAGKYADKAAGVIQKSSKKIDSAMNSLSKAASTVGNVSKKAAIVGGAIGGAAIVGGKAMLDQAGNLEQYRNTLNVVMKDQKKAASTFKWASQFANKTPFETDEIVQATVKLTSYGMEAQKVLPQIGDMASAMGKDMDQAVEAVADAQTGELERLKEFGITKSMIVAQAAKKMKKVEVVNNKGQITNQKAFNEALFSLMEERYKGSMDIQSKSWKGILSTITGVAKSGIAQIAGITDTGDIANGSFFDIAKKKASELGDVFVKLQESGKFDELQKKLGELASNGINKVIEYTPKVMEFIQKIIDNGPQIIDIVERVGIGFLTWKAVEGVANGIILISNLATVLGTLKLAHLGVAAAKAKDGLATLYLQGLYAKDAIVSGIKTAGTWAMVAAQGALNIATAVGTGIMGAFGAVLAFVTSPIGLVILGIGLLIAAGVALYKNWDAVKSAASSLWTGIKSMFATGVNWVIDKINKMIDVINVIPGIEIDHIAHVGGEASTASMPKYAKGGLARTASIFGEAGPEMAIPIKKKSPRSISLLNKTAELLGIGGNSSTSGNTYVYAPNYYGNTPQEIKGTFEEGYEEWVQFLHQYEHDTERESFA